MLLMQLYREIICDRLLRDKGYMYCNPLFKNNYWIKIFNMKKQYSMKLLFAKKASKKISQKQ